MNQRVIKLELDTHLHLVEGCGSELTFHVIGYRETKAGTPERYELKLKAYRCAAQTLLREMRKMHARDRERLARETARIEQEIQTLTEPSA